MPRSLFITDLTMPGDRNLLGGGKFGLVFKGEHEGKTVALKVLRRIRNNVVRRHSLILSNRLSQFRFKNRIFAGKR